MVLTSQPHLVWQVESVVWLLGLCSQRGLRVGDTALYPAELLQELPAPFCLRLPW